MQIIMKRSQSRVRVWKGETYPRKGLGMNWYSMLEGGEESKIWLKREAI